MIDLRRFQKPQRYIGNEWNVIKKNHHCKVSFCLAYPDLYEIGMSNLGLRIIYGILNEDQNIVCERTFMPAPDMISFLQSSRKKLFSLETKTDLDEFDIVAFHLGNELNFTNFIKMLELGGIPLLARKRKKTIVMAGGIINPEPLTDFIDVFYLGEFEEIAAAFIRSIKISRSKQERLEAIAELPGFYIPSLYDISLGAKGYEIKKRVPYAKLPLQRVFVRDFDRAYVPRRWLTPHTEITHDRVPVEIARGCPNRCSFCQARAVYYPYRERRPETILNIIADIYKNSGYENFSLLSLSASDHSRIENIIDSLNDFCKTRCIGLNLPSLRADEITGSLYQRLKQLKKVSLTIGLETASDNLRKKINKHIDVNKLFEATECIRDLGAKHIKLYFMFGLPGESDTDLQEIGYFLQRLQCRTKLSLNVSINIFIPKPFSEWEDAAMADENEIARKKRLITQNIPSRKNIKLSFSDFRQSFIEALICRADRSFGAVIQRACSLGALFDGYYEHFSWDIWKVALGDPQAHAERYLAPTKGNFPWSFIERCKP